jgi:Rrf2 family transcriptional regulator, cysteine metabolism repressor
MRISAKSRYALAAITYMAILDNKKECVTVISISEKLGISKIYLEQVFSLLKRAKLVISIKGAQGGYRLAKPAVKITIAEILHAVEQSLFEPSGPSTGPEAAYIEHSLQSLIWKPLDSVLLETLGDITLNTLAAEAEKQKGENNLMFYI